MPRWLVQALINVEASNEIEALRNAENLAETAEQLGMGDVVVQANEPVEPDPNYGPKEE